ncbi:hypothetical protein ASB62_06435 [Chlorobium limicola]|uniref:Uncharacterized protein n=1 Tax=Chlorobium limicola TaxID=1092 RepID=A0A101JGA4_CHLLI|nr:hypothetical protein ASB62_06435 [Chlorobium limicola]
MHAITVYYNNKKALKDGGLICRGTARKNNANDIFGINPCSSMAITSGSGQPASAAHRLKSRQPAAPDPAASRSPLIDSRLPVRVRIIRSGPEAGALRYNMPVHLPIGHIVPEGDLSDESCQDAAL